MVIFSANKLVKNLCFGLLTVSLATTSFTMAVTTAYAASSTVETAPQVDNNNNKGITYGLIGVGLLALLSGGHGSKSASPVVPSLAPSSSTGISSTNASSQPVSQPISQPAPAVTSGNIAADEQQAVALMNADRRAQGLPDLQVDSRLTNLGEQYAQDMINRNFFSHTNPEGQSPFDRMKQAGIAYTYAGENIAINQSVPAAETAFMNSPGHRANILNVSYTSVGIGVAYDKSGNVYIVQEFIKP
jgi:uncharacterized protein YkwD